MMQNLLPVISNMLEFTGSEFMFWT